MTSLVIHLVNVTLSHCRLNLLRLMFAILILVESMQSAATKEEWLVVVVLPITLVIHMSNASLNAKSTMIALTTRPVCHRNVEILAQVLVELTLIAVLFRTIQSVAVLQDTQVIHWNLAGLHHLLYLWKVTRAILILVDHTVKSTSKMVIVFAHVCQDTLELLPIASQNVS